MEDERNKINRLLDELEKKSELITALRAEIATKDKRIVELEVRLTTLTTIDAAINADGRTYAEGCAP